MSSRIEELQRRRTELENELQSLNEREKTLDDKVKTLEEKLAIQELEEQIKEKREALNQLEARVNDLDRKMKGPREKSEPADTVQEQPIAPKEAQQEDIVVMEPCVESELVSEPEQPESKKKRKFF